MLGDLEEFSVSKGKQIDKNRVYTYPVQGFENKDEVVYNLIVAECLRGVVFNEVDDLLNICLRYDPGTFAAEFSAFTNTVTDQNLCFNKAKARVVATSRKFPGFFKFSGYKQVNYACPDIVMSKKQLRMLIDETLEHFPAQAERLSKKTLEEMPLSSFNLPKTKLYVRIAGHASRQARNNFKNDLMNFI